MVRKKMATISVFPSKIVIALLAIYRYLISPFLGQNCRYYPCCSNYAQIAIERYGILAGGWLTIKRVLRCQPLCAGGFDPVPDKPYSQRLEIRQGVKAMSNRSLYK